MRALTAAQSAALAAPRYQAIIRVLCDNGTGAMVDLSTLVGANWIKTVKWSETMDDRCGKFTITLMRERYSQSLAPMVQNSQLNTLTGSYLPALAVGRKIEIDTAVIALDAAVQSTDWVISFQGAIDTIDPGKVDFEIEIDGRDLGGAVADRVAEATIVCNAGANLELETSMQDDVVNGCYTPPGGTLDATAPTLFTPTSPSWVLSTQYGVNVGEGCLDKLSQLAEQIGWDVRFLWDNGTGAFRLTLWQPPRTAPAVNESFEPGQIWGVQQLESDRSWVRNVVSVMYGQTSPPGGVVGGGAYLDPFSPIVVTSPTSITKYGRRFCQIGLAATSNILDSTHATDLANAVLSDLEDPLLVAQVQMPFRPEVMLGDYYTFNAPTPWWDQAQSLGVTGIAHEFDLPADKGDQAKTQTILTVRGYPGGSVGDWHQAMAGPGIGPPVKTNTPATPAIAGVVSNIRGIEVTQQAPNLNETDWYESQLHVSLTSGFVPNSTPFVSGGTLVDRGRRVTLRAFGLAAGTTYYAVVVVVDRQGNQTASAQQAITTATIQPRDLGAIFAEAFEAYAPAALGATSPTVPVIYGSTEFNGGASAGYSTVTGTFTAPSAARYLFRASLHFTALDSTSTATLQLYLQRYSSGGSLIEIKQGIIAAGELAPTSPTTKALFASVESSLKMNAGDYVEVGAYWQGSNLDSVTPDATYSRFSGEFLGPS